MSEAAQDETYTIVAKAGPELEDQLALADWHCQKIANAQYVEALLADPIQAEIDRLQERLSTIRDRTQNNAQFHEHALVLWVHEANLRDAIGATITLAHGTINTRQTKGKTDIDEEGLLRYAADHPEFETLIKAVVDKSAVRKRLELTADGRVLDKETGELIDEPLIWQVEPPGISVKIEAEAPLLIEEETENG